MPRPITSSNGHPHPLVQDDVLARYHLREADPAVVKLVHAAEQAEPVLHHCLGLGASTAKLAKKTLDTEVQQAFDEMKPEMERRAVLDEDEGVLARTHTVAA
jgi:hypothetical protein